ncbi:COP9 signalosome complex subunit 8 [Patella vulgata]|uniref:COP9 signalosome complex subunit 8 n=1 Tax=Patella vulgata TaxID=6465 RepID=UPI0024A8766E|nr:COP9 signalosome complex subunit 8 [Patella vulgata]
MAVHGRKTDFRRLERDLEAQELESPGGIAGSYIYSQLLSIYLVHNDTCNAKFLWKRIPQNIKTSNTELNQIWAVGQKMWQRDYPGVYETLKYDWSDRIKPIMNSLTESIRQGAFRLVSLAYSSINSEEFASFVGMPVSEAVQAAVAKGWIEDAQNKILTPKKAEKIVDPPLPSERQLSVLTDYVSFLEN